MGKTGVLGSFEELVLVATLRRGDDAYAVTIRRELVERTGNDVAMGAVYATLDRLAEKRLVTSDIERRSGRVGRPRRYYAVTDAGLTMLAETKAIRDAMWTGLTLKPAEGRE